MSEHQQPQATFKSFSESTREDWQIIGKAFNEFASDLPARILKHLELLKGDCGGFPVDRFEHCLQTATRALEGGGEAKEIGVVGTALIAFTHR